MKTNTGLVEYAKAQLGKHNLSTLIETFSNVKGNILGEVDIPDFV